MEEANQNRSNHHGCAWMHRAVEDQLKHDVYDDPRGDLVPDGRHAASQQFSSASSTLEQPEQVGRISRLGISEPSANPQHDGNHRLQDEA